MANVLTAVEVFHPERILSASNANKLMDWVRDCLATGHKTLLIDFQYASFLDNTGLGVLANVCWIVKEYGGEIALASVKGQIQMLLETSRMEHLFQIYPSQEEFLKEHQVWCCALKGYIK
jgi:anti-anti-sigma factor